MMEWDEARSTVQDVFFRDTFKLYLLQITTDEIGEETAIKGDEIGTYTCNAQYHNIGKQSREQGITTPQLLRISCPKDVPLVRGSLYCIELVEARIQFNPEEVWEVQDWVESQISNVITCKKGDIV